MAHIDACITVTASFQLDEVQLRALDALAGYGTSGFLKVFYKHMGRAYLEPHEEGLVSLFETIRRDVPEALRQVDLARKQVRDATQMPTKQLPHPEE